MNGAGLIWGNAMGYTVGKGLDKYLQSLGNLALDAPKAVTEAIKAGAGEVVGAIREEIEALPIEQHVTGTAGTPLKGITAAQKKGLIDGLGVSREMDQNGRINRKIGFDGYNATRTKKYPKGQPNVVIARALISGSSFRQKNDFVGRAVRKSRKQAEQKIKDTIDRSIQNTIKGV